MPHLLADNPDWPNGVKKPRHPIQVTKAPEYCLYSTLQRENEIITRNQRVLYDKLVEIEDRLKRLMSY